MMKNKNQLFDINSKSEILNKINEISKRAISSILIVVPKLKDIEDICLYEIKSSTSIRIACKVNHLEIFDELISLGNVKIKNYEREDRYGIIRDNEELFISIFGEDKNNLLTFYTKDIKHIQVVNTLITECWIRGTIVE